MDDKQKGQPTSSKHPLRSRTSRQSPTSTPLRNSSELDGDMTLKELWTRGLKLSYEQHKIWRKQRKKDALHRPLEFCLRPYLALLLYTLALSLIGRGLTHFSGETPYTAVWWSEELCWPIAELMGGWEIYSTSLQVESTLGYMGMILGILFLLLGLWATMAPHLLSQSLTQSITQLQKSQLKQKATLSESIHLSQNHDGGQRLSDPPRGAKLSVRLCLLIFLLQSHYVFAQWWGHNLRWATVIEHGIHLALPISCALMLPYSMPRFEPYAERLMRLAVSCCFIGHGLYALNIAPLPASFLTMTLNLTPFAENGARTFLVIMGLLDLIAAFLIWLPISELKRSALVYMIIWGALTALARPLGQPSLEFIDRIIIWGPELIWRLPHTLAPFWLWRRMQLSSNVSRISTV